MEGFLDRAFEIEESRDESLFLRAVMRYKEGKADEALAALESMSRKEDAAVKAFMQRLEAVRK